jgi:hypothetical protein
VLGAMPISPVSGDPRIGEVIESHPPEPRDEVELDASLVRVDDDVKLSGIVRETVISRRPCDFDDESEPIIVFKRGSNARGLTEGLLDPTPEPLRVELPQLGGPSPERDYLRCWFVHGMDGVHPLARAGDSGSIGHRNTRRRDPRHQRAHGTGPLARIGSTGGRRSTAGVRPTTRPGRQPHKSGPTRSS